MPSELMPCPFGCGLAEMREWDWPYTRFQVRCPKCKCSQGVRKADKAEAITAWNTRTPPATQAGEDALGIQGLLSSPTPSEQLSAKANEFCLAGDYRMAYLKQCEAFGVLRGEFVPRGSHTDAELLDEIAEAISDTLDMDWQPSWPAPNILALINRERAEAHAAGRAAERAEVVAWLRNGAQWDDPVPTLENYENLSNADAIELGQHGSKGDA